MGQSPEAGLPHAGPAAVRAGSPSGADVACSRRGSGGRSAPGARSCPRANGGGTRPAWPSARGRPLDLCARLFRRSDPAPQAPPGSRSGRGRRFSWRPSRSFAPGWEIPSRSVGAVGYSGRISGTACCPAWARLAREVALGLLETTVTKRGLRRPRAYREQQAREARPLHRILALLRRTGAGPVGRTVASSLAGRASAPRGSCVPGLRPVRLPWGRRSASDLR